MAHESTVLLLEAAAAAVGAGPEEAYRRSEPRYDRRSDAQHDQSLVRGGAGRRQCEYQACSVSTKCVVRVPSV